MSIVVKEYYTPDELINAGIADEIHNMFMAVFIADVVGVTDITGVAVNADRCAGQMEDWAVTHGKHPVALANADAYLVAYDSANHVVVGAATLSFEDDAGSRGLRLGNVFVVPTARRQGVATLLVAAARTSAEVSGVKHLSLTVTSDNPVAWKLYAKLGFKSVRTLMMSKVT